jgi:hypothetical protein
MLDTLPFLSLCFLLTMLWETMLIFLFLSALAAGSLALKISVDVETVLFAIQDIFTQGILGYWLLLSHDNAQGV